MTTLATTGPWMNIDPVYKRNVALGTHTANSQANPDVEDFYHDSLSIFRRLRSVGDKVESLPCPTTEFDIDPEEESPAITWPKLLQQMALRQASSRQADSLYLAFADSEQRLRFALLRQLFQAISKKPSTNEALVNAWKIHSNPSNWIVGRRGPAASIERIAQLHRWLAKAAKSTAVSQSTSAEVDLTWGESAETIVARLEAANHSLRDRVTTVLFLETTPLSAEQRRRAVPLLIEFIEEHRFSEDSEVLTGVGSAVRKLALNMSDEDVERYAKLFAPTDTRTLPYEVELELAKSIVWRLQTSPPASPQQFPQLESSLIGLASDYLRPRLILQRNYAATTLNAVQGVVLLQAEASAAILTAVIDLRMAWFQELLQRRLQRVARQLLKKERAEVAASLSSVEDAVTRLAKA